jgi:biotin transport system substrate-specific component
METRDLVRIALFAALLAVLGLFPKFDVPIAGGVPITMQSLGVMLAGVLLGPRHGTLAVLLFVCVVLMGAPLLAGGRGGGGVLFGPTAGFFIGWIPGAAVAGWLMGRLSRLPVLAAGLLASAVGGIVVDYLFGIAWLSYAVGMGVSRATLGSLVFLPGDLIKAFAAGCVAEAARRLEPSRFTEAR